MESMLTLLKLTSYEKFFLSEMLENHLKDVDQFDIDNFGDVYLSGLNDLIVKDIKSDIYSFIPTGSVLRFPMFISEIKLTNGYKKLLEATGNDYIQINIQDEIIKDSDYIFKSDYLIHTQIESITDPCSIECDDWIDE
jgi:hypothetical protein